MIVHEPPLFSLLADDPTAAPMLGEIRRRIRPVIERISAGDHAGAAEQFVDTVAFGPGSWAQMPDAARQTFIEHAPTFLDEANDPEQLAFELGAIRSFRAPVQLTQGDASPPVYAPVISALASSLPHAEVYTFAGAGHIPHLTHPSAYIEAVNKFIENTETK